MPKLAKPITPTSTAPPAKVNPAIRDPLNGLTARQSAFVTLYVETNDLADAYLGAGYKAKDRTTASTLASALVKHTKVSASIAAFREKTAKVAQVTIASLTAELEEARKLAIECEQPAAATSAIMSKAKLHGLDINRTQIESKVSVSFDGAAEKLFEALASRAELEGVGEIIEHE